LQEFRSRTIIGWVLPSWPYPLRMVSKVFLWKLWSFLFRNAFPSLKVYLPFKDLSELADLASHWLLNGLLNLPLLGFLIPFNTFGYGKQLPQILPHLLCPHSGFVDPLWVFLLPYPWNHPFRFLAFMGTLSFQSLYWFDAGS
jgi:hypothetical protein